MSRGGSSYARRHGGGMSAAAFGASFSNPVSETNRSTQKRECPRCHGEGSFYFLGAGSEVLERICDCAAGEVQP